MFGLLNSASAISAALRIAWPATPALPPADSGRMSAIRTWPVPIVVSATGGPAGACGSAEGDSDGIEENVEPEQPASTAPDAANRPNSEWRRVSNPDPLTGIPADKAALLTAFTRGNDRAAPICHSGGELLTKPERYGIHPQP